MSSSSTEWYHLTHNTYHVQILTLHSDGYFSRWTLVSQYRDVLILDFIGAKDDGGDSDYKSCKAPVKSSPPTNQHPVFLQAGCPSCHPTDSVRALSLSLSSFYRPFSRWTCVSRCLLKQRMMEVVVTTAAIGHAKLQSNHHYQQTNIQFFYRPDALPVAQPTVREGKSSQSSFLAFFSYNCRISRPPQLVVGRH